MRGQRIVKATEDAILEASEVVRAGGLVVYPTDTVYGLGCDPKNLKGVRRLLKVKGERSKPLPILGSSLKDIDGIAILLGEARRVALNLWPGPITLILKRRETVPDEVTMGLDTIGVRIPDHPVALKLISRSGGLLVGTSANKTGMEPPREVSASYAQLDDDVDIYLDGGVTPIGRPSTVVDFTSSEPKILREGSITHGEIVKLLKR